MSEIQYDKIMNGDMSRAEVVNIIKFLESQLAEVGGDCRAMYKTLRDLQEIVKSTNRFISIEQIVAICAPLKEGPAIDPLIQAESRVQALEKDSKFYEERYIAWKIKYEALEKELAEAKKHLCPECGDNKCEWHTLPDEKTRIVEERNHLQAEALKLVPLCHCGAGKLHCMHGTEIKCALGDDCGNTSVLHYPNCYWPKIESVISATDPDLQDLWEKRDNKK